MHEYKTNIAAYRKYVQGMAWDERLKFLGY